MVTDAILRLLLAIVRTYDMKQLNLSGVGRLLQVTIQRGADGAACCCVAV